MINLRRYTMVILTGVVLSGLLLFLSCNKSGGSTPTPPAPPANFPSSGWSVDDKLNLDLTTEVGFNPVIRLYFRAKLDKNTVPLAVTLFNNTEGVDVAFNTSYEKSDSVIVLRPATALTHANRFAINVSDALRSAEGGKFIGTTSFSILTKIDSTAKFPTLTDDQLLDKVQQQTFKYFWDFGHPVSGLARERNTSGEIVTSGGSGFGIMALVTGIHRNFITRSQGLTRMQTITNFLKNTAQTFHGAFPHWLNGTTGVVVPFSTKDNGADLVETSYLMAGLMTARQYFDGADVAETNLRADINTILDRVEYSWFRKANENVLYWHWSPNYGWDMNLPIRGWNEGLITYVMAATSKNYSIPQVVYTSGFARNGAMQNVNSYFGLRLPLGEAFGGPLFFAHYAFLGINPNGLSDQYANYQTQVVNHSRINYEHCKTNPRGYYGYSASCWGLTASDIPNGYTASSPTNDVGVIAPTAALSSFPYTPVESMQALKFFYYTMGDKLWKQYGFVDAFSLYSTWYANSFLAIDQGPIIIMIENYRSGLIWNLFTSSPEVKTGLRNLGFSAPYL